MPKKYLELEKYETDLEHIELDIHELGKQLKNLQADYWNFKRTTLNIIENLVKRPPK